jgi:hypothetical protein
MTIKAIAITSYGVIKDIFHLFSDNSSDGGDSTTTGDADNPAPDLNGVAGNINTKNSSEPLGGGGEAIGNNPEVKDTLQKESFFSRLFGFKHKSGSPMEGTSDFTKDVHLTAKDRLDELYETTSPEASSSKTSINILTPSLTGGGEEAGYDSDKTEKPAPAYAAPRTIKVNKGFSPYGKDYIINDDGK